MSNIFIDLLRADGSIVVNKKLARLVGLHEAIVLSEIISRHAYHSTREELNKDGMFFLTVEKLEGFTTLSKYIQGKAIKNLKELGLIETKQIGMPSKRYIKLNEKELYNFLTNDLSTSISTFDSVETASNQGSEKLANKKSKNSPPRSEETRQQEVKKLATNNTKDNTEYNTKDNTENIFLRELNKRAIKISLPTDVHLWLVENHMKFIEQQINFDHLFKWLESNHETYSYTELCVGMLQLLESYERIESTGRYLNSTFANIEKHVENFRKKQIKKTDRQIANEQTATAEYEPPARSVEPVPFYNWLEERE